jgi:hypothetical protein
MIFLDFGGVLKDSLVDCDEVVFQMLNVPDGLVTVVCFDVGIPGQDMGKKG